MNDKNIPRELIYSYFQKVFRPMDPGGGGGGYSLCKAIRGCAALVGHFFEKNP